MATITIGLSNSAVVTGSRNYTLTDQHTTRWIAAMRVILKPRFPIGSTPTDAQVLAAWADEVIDRTKRQVLDYETQALAPTPIDISAS